MHPLMLNSGTRTVLIALVACVVGFGVVSAEIPGLRITTSSTQQLSFTLTPQVRSWDTVMTSEGPTIRPTIAGARLRQTAEADVIQWVIPFDVIVPGADRFSLDDVQSAVTNMGSPLQPALTPEGMVIPTGAVVASRITAAYAGIAGGRHVATVTCVVAETRKGITTVTDSVTAAMHFAPTTAVTSVGGEIRSIGAVNENMPWRVPTPTARQKVGEHLQGFERLDNVWSLQIEREGIYRLTADQLKGAGVPLTADVALTIKLFGRGGKELSETIEPAQNDTMIEQEIVVRTNADGSISEIVFYASGPTGWSWGGDHAEHYIHHYAVRGGYLLTYGGEPGKRSVLRQAAPGPAANAPLTVTGLAFLEDEIVNPYTSGSGRRWYGRSIENGGSLVYTTQLPGLVRTGTVSYFMTVAHKGSSSGTVTIFENSQPIAQRYLPPVPLYMDTYSGQTNGTLSTSQLASDGRSILRFAYESADRSASGLLDWFEIQYPRGLIAADNEFSFFTAPQLEGVTEYAVNGFAGGETFGFDVTDPARPRRVENVAPSGGLFSIREQLTAGSPQRYYISSTFRTPLISKLSALTLRNDAVNGKTGALIVITHPSTRASAERYADYRRAQGELSVSVVSTDDIYHEFSYGVQDPTAVRDYLGFAFRHGAVKPVYVLFWGDGHYDYKNLTTATTNFILPYESLDPDNQSYGLSTYTTDDYFVRIQGNDSRPDIAIGRLPVTSNATGDVLLDKIQHYESQTAQDDWRTRIALIADDGQTSEGASDGTLHLEQSERLINYYVPAAFQPKKIYLVEYPTENVARGRRKTSVTSEYVSTVNTSGVLLLNWIGHGNPRVWAHEFVFERETTPPQMTNVDKPFFLTAATCDFARFDLADVQSGAEELVLLPNGGAVGAFSAARVVFASSNAEINQEFYKQLFTSGADGRAPRMGDVMYRVKQRLNGDNDEKFYLLGDPALRLLIPDHRVVFETINDTTITDTSLIHLQALSTVTVTGFIERPSQAGADTTFNGTATISLLDAERQVTVTDTDENFTVNSFTMPGAALSRGSYRIESGRFTATFVVPKDIAFSTQQASLYGYGVSDNDRTAMGVTDRLVVDGAGTDSYDDDAGPNLSVSLDSRYFRSGDVVRNNPILIVDLSDETGINTTGVGVGHDIEATFDGGEYIETLTESFSTSLEDSRSGTATKQIFGLRGGEHYVTVRAWDVLNNMSEVTTSFRIAYNDEGIVTSWLMNYPNPFANSTTIRFQHNVSGPFTAEILILDVQGRQISRQPMEIRDMQTAEVVWDGRDDDGVAVGSGIYLCIVRATDSQGQTADVRGKLALIR